MHFVAKSMERVFAIISESRITEFITNATGPTVTELSKAIGLFEHKVEILHADAMEGVFLKNELVASGLHLNVDFCWHYHTPYYDNFGHEAVIPKRVIFEFRDAAMATFYKLKWHEIRYQ